MNILFIKHFFVGCIVSDIPRLSVFVYFQLYDIGYNILLIYYNIFILYHNIQITVQLIYL